MTDEQVLLRQAQILCDCILRDVKFDDEFWATLQKLRGYADLILYRKDNLTEVDARQIIEAISNLGAIRIQMEEGTR